MGIKIRNPAGAQRGGGDVRVGSSADIAADEFVDGSADDYDHHDGP